MMKNYNKVKNISPEQKLLEKTIKGTHNDVLINYKVFYAVVESFRIAS